MIGKVSSVRGVGQRAWEVKGGKTVTPSTPGGSLQSTHRVSSTCLPSLHVVVEPTPSARLPIQLLTLLVDPPCLDDGLVDAVVLSGGLRGMRKCGRVGDVVDVDNEQCVKYERVECGGGKSLIHALIIFDFHF